MLKELFLTCFSHAPVYSMELWESSHTSHFMVILRDVAQTLLLSHLSPSARKSLGLGTI